MNIKLLFILFTVLFINIHAQDYVFGKVTSEDRQEMPEVTVINIRTGEKVTTNRDGHFMISGRAGDELRFVKAGYERINKKLTVENTGSPVNVSMIRAAELIAEVEIRKNITGDLSIDSKALNAPKKVEKLKSDMAVYMSQRSDPRIMAAKAGEFVQPKGQGFSIGKVKNKWDDLDFANYLMYALGEKYFADLKIDRIFIQHFIYYVFAGGFERKNILKYGFCSDADLMRFQNAVLIRIASYRAPQTQR